MKTSLVALFSLIAGCAGPPGTDTADIDTSDVDSEGGVAAVCQPADGGTVASRAIAGGTWSCEGDDCTLSLPSSEPTRNWARMRVADGAMILDAWDVPELIVASDDGVFALTEPGMVGFDLGQGSFWIARADGVIAVDGTGTITRHCAFPDALDALETFGVVADRLVLNGVDAERQLVAVQSTDTGWEPVGTELAAWRYREYADNEVLVLGYGYFEWRDFDTGESVLNGDSDDDFGRAAICADGTYWVGGGTGRIMHCTTAHECEYVEADVFPFQAEAYGCDADGDLWWLEHPDRGLLTTGGVWSYDPMPAGMRTGTEQYGRRWTVVEAQ